MLHGRKEDALKLPAAFGPELSKLILRLFALVLIGLLSLSRQSIATEEPTVDLPIDALLTLQNGDGNLRAGSLVSIDKGWVVGDRGLVLATQDGGKTWIPQSSGASASLYGVHFQNEKKGCIVGGLVRKHSLRSEGIVRTTKNGGATWKTIDTPQLPRLTGVQGLDPDHLIAWGDYSTVFNTSCFESIDGGETWNAIDCRTGHVRSAAWKNSQEGILVDALGRVSFFSSGSLASLQIGGDPSKPIHRVRFLESGYWLLGSQGQVYHSLDGRRWSTLLLPGNAVDHGFIDLHDVYGNGNDVWIVGNPGSVTWHSSDLGQTWNVQKTKQNMGWNAVCGFRSDRLIALGAMANILGTRNSGKAWWVEHSNSERVAMLNIAANQKRACWEALALCSWQHGKQSAFLAMHEDELETNVDMLPPIRARLDLLQNRLGLALVGVDSHYPIRGTQRLIGDHWDAYDVRSEYQEKSYSAVRIAQTLRQLRPDVLVTHGNGGDALDQAVFAAISEGMQLASETKYRIFSPSAEIPETPWKVTKLFVQAPSALLSVGRDQGLSNSGVMLNDILEAVYGMRCTTQKELFGPKGSRAYLLAQSSNMSDTFQRDFFGGLPNSQSSRRDVMLKNLVRYKQMLRMSQQRREIEDLLKMGGGRWERDSRWENHLKTLIDGDTTEEANDRLLEFAQACKEAGYWNRWEVCLGQILRRSPNSGAGEAAFKELLRHENSKELQLWLASERTPEADDSEHHAAVAMSKSQPSSPFGSSSPVIHDAQVQSAAFLPNGERQLNPKVAPPSSPNGLSKLNGPPDLIELGSELNISAASMNNLLDEKSTQWIHKTMSEQNGGIFLDPQMQLIELTPSIPPDEKIEPSGIFQRLLQGTAIAGWCQVGEQENAWLRSKMHVDSMKVTKTNSRPHLDGVLDDECWRQGNVVVATDPWGSSNRPGTSVKFLYDAEFLYVAIQCPIENVASVENATTKRQRDGMKESLDHVWLRFDTDRDYASWFAFGIDENGQTADRCCDLVEWNPQWYMSHMRSAKQWTAELAIPVDALLGKSIGNSECWSANIHRSLPDGSSQNNGRVASDRFLPQGMRLLHFLP